MKHEEMPEPITAAHLVALVELAGADLDDDVAERRTFHVDGTMHGRRDCRWATSYKWQIRTRSLDALVPGDVLCAACLGVDYTGANEPVVAELQWFAPVFEELLKLAALADAIADPAADESLKTLVAARRGPRGRGHSGLGPRIVALIDELEPHIASANPLAGVAAAANHVAFSRAERPELTVSQLDAVVNEWLRCDDRPGCLTRATAAAVAVGRVDAVLAYWSRLDAEADAARARTDQVTVVGVGPRTGQVVGRHVIVELDRRWACSVPRVVAEELSARPSAHTGFESPYVEIGVDAPDGVVETAVTLWDGVADFEECLRSARILEGCDTPETPTLDRPRTGGAAGG